MNSHGRRKNLSPHDSLGLRKIRTIHGEFLTFPNDLVSSQIEKYGAHTRNELAMVLDHINPGDTVVDLGAHIGTFAIPIAKKVGASGRVLAVEGDRELFEVLNKNIALNQVDNIITSANAIVGDSSTLKVRRESVPGNTGAGFYVTDDTSRQSTCDAAELLTSHGLKAPQFIKIDIEGMELFALNSLKELLAKHRPALYLEIVRKQLARHACTVKDINDLLKEMGYLFYCNVGKRNSAGDDYEMAPLEKLMRGGGFFDVLALAE